MFISLSITSVEPLSNCWLKLCQTAFLRFIWGPVSLVALVFLALRDVSIAVGTWTCERLLGEAGHGSRECRALRSLMVNHG